MEQEKKEKQQMLRATQEKPDWDRIFTVDKVVGPICFRNEAKPQEQSSSDILQT